ncbi:hematopoietic death receptor isoform X2 [Pangasianodon hypophthalmus]|uniref:hematopoietic death receptor isoform X2 n=1 Tax=Pangasianodon hypophthalmus TaxID=310915 RepID=UPI000EFF0587|nr:hematopoietic death receptor isoform X2 [Pangasianodon hypophthalmus]
MRHFTSLLMLWIWAWSSSGSRTERDIVCRDGMGYESNDICCLNCPAGTFVKEACSTAFERGVCQQCDFDTYTEHDNGLLKCLMCTKCRPDQELVERCNSTRNTRCQCKAGSFCLPDQACEVCKICRKCKEDEEMVESCTAHSNTICRKTGSISSSTSTVVVSMVVVAFFMIIVIIGCVLYRRTSAQLASRWPRGMLKTCIENGSDLVEAKQNAVNGTLEEGAQILTQPEIEKLRRLVPLNGDESLRKSFDLFGEIDLNYHNRFFRLLGLSDNAIRSAEVSCSSPEDRVYELLKIWMEKEGMKANFKSLIEALLSLNQRLSAENIVARAVDCGYFSYEED